jgi:hypothetical protein
VVEVARLESVYRFIAYPGFESPSLRQGFIRPPLMEAFSFALQIQSALFNFVFPDISPFDRLGKRMGQQLHFAPCGDLRCALLDIQVDAVASGQASSSAKTERNGLTAIRLCVCVEISFIGTTSNMYRSRSAPMLFARSITPIRSAHSLYASVVNNQVEMCASRPTLPRCQWGLGNNRRRGRIATSSAIRGFQASVRVAFSAPQFGSIG